MFDHVRALDAHYIQHSRAKRQSAENASQQSQRSFAGTRPANRPVKR